MKHLERMMLAWAVVLFAAAVIWLIVGCTIRGEVTMTYQGIYHCTDLRDGERFDYNTNTIRDARIGIGAPTTVTFTDTTGRVRQASTDENAYIKCVPDKTAQLTKAHP